MLCFDRFNKEIYNKHNRMRPLNEKKDDPWARLKIKEKIIL
jgi:hypothetical protein